MRNIRLQIDGAVADIPEQLRAYLEKNEIAFDDYQKLRLQEAQAFSTYIREFNRVHKADGLVIEENQDPSGMMFWTVTDSVHEVNTSFVAEINFGFLNLKKKGGSGLLAKKIPKAYTSLIFLNGGERENFHLMPVHGLVNWYAPPDDPRERVIKAFQGIRDEDETVEIFLAPSDGGSGIGRKLSDSSGMTDSIAKQLTNMAVGIHAQRELVRMFDVLDQKRGPRPHERERDPT